ncbi:hypothetical protein PQO03_17220 [Lentisphaera profundi]|uniref:GH10 domain-containing protein n=1 Tax=Lentisphaera profundi TaxID=1658616 RepID=A0ABY7VWJ6_9BACT|nr:hypothetical protein [Lentisphaera profundi]WDE97570.1 hypothetical protein PQO03_17220 [Lentisphaera profundi]
MKFNSRMFLLFSSVMLTSQAASIKDFAIDKKLDQAYARVEGDKIILGTGRVERQWKWGGNGLVTTSLKDLKNDKQWLDLNNKKTSDWNYRGYMPANSGKLLSLKAEVSNDGGFAEPHMELTAEVEYAKISVKYIVWAFPGAKGLRTQVKIKSHMKLNPGNKLQYDITPKHDEYNKTSSSKILTGRTESLAIDTTGLVKRGMGYYNHTQGRNQLKTPLVHESLHESGNLGWASILSLENKEGGVFLVKESHKCVNQAGVNTGVFEVEKNHVSSTGWGILPQDLTTTYQGFWANWVIVHDGKTAEQRELALKEFDRVRYSIDPKRDIYIMANTWGSGESKNCSQSAAREENVLVEIASQNDLGIDVQQVDDGWQGWMTAGPHWRPVAKLDFKEMMRQKNKKKKNQKSEDGEVYLKNAKVYEMYPNGWSTIKAQAKKDDIRLGLWAHARVPLEDLKWNFDQGGFKSYKIDFVNARDFTNLNEIMTKVRKFVQYTNHQVRMNWDVTEHPPRIGYFFGREYGNIYLENRKTMSPANVVYIPHLVLRDAWELSKYNNLNKFQISVQNGDRCNKQVSDAHKHTADYLVAQTLMGSPIFFQETHYYSDEARELVKPLLKAYKAVRSDMYRGYVFPVGEMPDNKSWSGFQNYNSESDKGFLTIFRQINNDETKKSIALKFVANQELELTNLMTGEKQVQRAGADGSISLAIDKAADYRFYQYTVIGK